jgi:hypothetical protein
MRTDQRRLILKVKKPLGLSIFVNIHIFEIQRRHINKLIFYAKIWGVNNIPVLIFFRNKN